MANALDGELKGTRSGIGSEPRLLPVAQVTVYDEQTLARLRASLEHAGFPAVAFRSEPTLKGRQAVPPVLACWTVFISVDHRWPAFQRWLRSFGLMVLGNSTIRRDGSAMEYTTLAPR